MSAAAASRDVTLFHAHNLLHKHNYDLVRFTSTFTFVLAKVGSREGESRT
jgi:hypothetical protein